MEIDSQSDESIPNGNLNMRMTKENEVVGSGIPLLLFSSDYVQPSIDAHDAIALAMTSDPWTQNLKEIYKNTLQNFVESTQRVQDAMSKYGLTLDETLAVVYYSSDARSYGGKREDSPFMSLNRVLATRNFNELENWKPFLYFLLMGLYKIPDYRGEVFRALDKPVLQLSKQYKPGNNVVWVAFTSTSRNRSVMDSFSTKSSGTFMLLDISEGKDISEISVFMEEEVLLLPNAYFVVKDVLSDHLKKLLKLPECMDALYLVQSPTPLHLRMNEGVCCVPKLVKSEVDTGVMDTLPKSKIEGYVLLRKQKFIFYWIRVLLTLEDKNLLINEEKKTTLILLTDGWKIRRIDFTLTVSGKQNGFEVWNKITKKAYIFSAKTEDEQIKWILNVRKNKKNKTSK